MTRVAIIGCGNLGQAIAKGLAETAQGEYKVHATRRNLATVDFLKDSGVVLGSDNCSATRGADIVILAVKPYNVELVLNEISADLKSGGQILISAASGVSTDTLREYVGLEIPVYRAMPNTAAGVGQSMTCISTDSDSSASTNTVKQLFDCIGKTVIIEEHHMEAATVLGACGIAYVMRFIRAMTQGGIQIGFSAELASLIASQTVKGAAELLMAGDSHPEREIDKVTTPKGCTIVGLNEMEHAGFSSSLIKGIVSSFEEI